jgi:hypothetical protein
MTHFNSKTDVLSSKTQYTKKNGLNFDVLPGVVGFECRSKFIGKESQRQELPWSPPE